MTQKKKTNPKSKDIYAELARIQKQMQVPKERKNDYGGYVYRTVEDILSGVIATGTTGVINISDELVRIGERYYVKATATFTFNHESVSSTAYAREALQKKGFDEAQITGSSSSYARKYALGGMFAVTDSTYDNAGTSKTTAKSAEPSVDLSAYDEKKFKEYIDKIDSVADLRKVFTLVDKQLSDDADKQKKFKDLTTGRAKELTDKK